MTDERDGRASGRTKEEVRRDWIRTFAAYSIGSGNGVRGAAGEAFKMWALLEERFAAEEPEGIQRGDGEGP